MSEIKRRLSQEARRAGQRGGFIVEFALLILLFFTLVFGIIELARIQYLWNTLQEVTRSAASMAAVTKFNDAAAKAALRQKAIFRDSAGGLMFGSPVTDEHLRIDYLAVTKDSSGGLSLTPIADSALPSCIAANRAICGGDPYNASCVRYVRVRICDPADSSSCSAVQYKPLTSLLPITFLSLPTSTTIVRTESLGYSPSAAQCP